MANHQMFPESFGSLVIGVYLMFGDWFLVIRIEGVSSR